MKNEKYQIEYGLKNIFAFLSSWVMALGTDGIYETINNIEYWTGVKVPLMGIPRDVCNGIKFHGMCVTGYMGAVLSR